MLKGKPPCWGGEWGAGHETWWWLSSRGAGCESWMWGAKRFPAITFLGRVTAFFSFFFFFSFNPKDVM